MSKTQYVIEVPKHCFGFAYNLSGLVWQLLSCVEDCHVRVNIRIEQEIELAGTPNQNLIRTPSKGL